MGSESKPQTLQLQWNQCQQQPVLHAELGLVATSMDQYIPCNSKLNNDINIAGES